ncbi:DUF3568 family protein [Francisella philomiragia]|uniref:DUF3568 family protein n=1 Tax=Francisella philomiragia TaxID=28110 RepID=A0ABS1GCZ6_9GAMM|nr:DUF3568 family protein [Francisella philomiragia]MBK2259252.1 DUF3568 family protein [Francisella philomiragia]MBK2302711.1 DUF3568 family protein [Francisella philomiragia]
MFKKAHFIILAVIILISLNSCVATALLIGAAVVAGGAVYYVNGDYIIEVPKDIRSVYNATIKTMQMDKQFSLLSQSYKDKTAEVKASQNGNDVTINLTSLSNRSTEIKIRVGTLGDEKDSINIANAITKNIT